MILKTSLCWMSTVTLGGDFFFLIMEKVKQLHGSESKAELGHVALDEPVFTIRVPLCLHGPTERGNPHSHFKLCTPIHQKVLVCSFTFSKKKKK